MEIFEILAKRRLITFGEPNINNIANIRYSELIDTAGQITDAVTKVDSSLSTLTHTYCANVSMSGGRGSVCSSPDCRLEKVSQLARFATLYSDRVFTYNSFSDYSPQFGHPPDKDSLYLRDDFITDVKVLLSLRPLIEAKLVQPFTPSLHHCQECLTKKVFGLEADRRFRKTFRKISKDFLEKMSVECQYQHGRYLFYCSAPEPYIEHGLLVVRPFSSLS